MKKNEATPLVALVEIIRQAFQKERSVYRKNTKEYKTFTGAIKAIDQALKSRNEN